MCPRKDERQIQASRHVLERSQVEKGPSEVEVCGLSFVVLPNVFSPRYFDSTRIFTPVIAARPAARFLEVGAGTGVTSIVVALHGAQRVLAVDINPTAVTNIALNAQRHNVEQTVEARQSDVFSAIRFDEQFDEIYWNLPFIYVQESYEYRSTLERALYDPGYKYTERFLSEARAYLAPDGRLLVGFADFGDIRLFDELAGRFKWSWKEVVREVGEEGGTVTFMLFELRTHAIEGAS